MRFVAIIIGLFMLVSGAACGVGGGAVVAVFGSDGVFESGDESLRTDTRALVLKADDIGEQEPDENRLDIGGIEVAVVVRAAQPDEEIFVGFARGTEVDAYLAAFEHEVVTDIEFDPFALKGDREGGTSAPAPPDAQDFWLESASGRGTQHISHGLERGDVRLVLMNADGSPGVDARGSLGVKVPYVFGIGIGLLASGVIVALLGLFVIVKSIFR